MYCMETLQKRLLFIFPCPLCLRGEITSMVVTPDLTGTISLGRCCKARRQFILLSILGFLFKINYIFLASIGIRQVIQLPVP